MMASRLKNALSSKISLVSVFTPECKPPKIPAIARALLSSAITKVSSLSLASVSSSNVRVSPLFAIRTFTLPSIAARLNACIGWPSSNKIKLVTSTIGSMLRIPQRRSFSLNHSGVAAATLTLRSTRPT